MNSERHGRRRERERERGTRWKEDRRGKEKVWETSAITEHLRGHGAQPDMEQSQISIRPNREYTPPPPLSSSPQERGGEGRTSAAHLAPPLPSRAEVEALLGVGAWPAVLVTVPKLPQNGLLRSLPLSLPPLRIFPLSLSFDALVADNHPSQKDTCPLSAFSLTFLPSTTFVSILSHPSARSARFPRFSNLPESTLDSVDKRDNKCPSAIAWSRTRVHRTDGFRERPRLWG